MGKRFTFQTKPAGAWDGVIHCQVLEVIPNERFVYSWKSGHEENAGYSSVLDPVVTWTLSGTANGTRVRLVHAGFVVPKNESALETMGKGWVVPSRTDRAPSRASGADPRSTRPAHNPPTPHYRRAE